MKVIVIIGRLLIWVIVELIVVMNGWCVGLKWLRVIIEIRCIWLLLIEWVNLFDNHWFGGWLIDWCVCEWLLEWNGCLIEFEMKRLFMWLKRLKWFWRKKKSLKRSCWMNWYGLIVWLYEMIDCLIMFSLVMGWIV